MEDIERFTDFGNAERLIENNIQNVRFCWDLKKWLIWDGQRWAVNDGSKMIKNAMATVRKISEEANAATEDPDLMQQLLVHTVRSQTPSRLKAMIFLAQSDPRIQIDLDSLDTDPMMFNCFNGTVDLRTGGLLEHTRDRMITKIAPVNYNPDDICPLFFEFMNQIMGGNEAWIAYLQRIFGYCLTGLTDEQSIFFFVGDGANGKSTLLEIFREIMGDYARHTPSTTLLMNNKGVRNDIARLKGARFVSSVEIGLGSKIDEALVKQITGGDPVTSRLLYHEYFELKPTFKLVVAMNHDPEIRGVDHGIWRRMRIIPFDAKIPEDQMDRDLLTKLKKELPGILNWAVQGCLAWQEQGLAVPPEILTRTQTLKVESDHIGIFLSDCCTVDPDLKISLKELFDLYQAWCIKNAYDVIAKKTFGSFLKLKGYRQCKSNDIRFWRGISKRQATNNYPIIALDKDVVVGLH